MSSQAAVNRLIAAAIAHRAAVASGQGPSFQRRFLAAVDAYLAQRGPIDAARDNFLIEFPDADALSAAVKTYDPNRPDSLRTAALHGPVLTIPDVRTDVWVTPGGFLCCPNHIDGCPPGDDYFRAWHRLTLTSEADISDPENACGVHTGIASNRCGLREAHPGDCDDLGGDPVNTGCTGARYSPTLGPVCPNHPNGCPRTRPPGR